jgi:hypothetical protein
MKRILLTALTLGLLAAGTAVVLGSPADEGVPAPTGTVNEDVSGPCDEAEHANDPRCAPGGQDRDEDDDRGRDHPEDDGVRGDDGDDDFGEDISGPCDEAEHANDPRCTGAVPGDDDGEDRVDNSGPGSLNSGPGSVNSGHDDDDDSSGHGSGDSDDDDSSGPGSGDDD